MPLLTKLAGLVGLGGVGCLAIASTSPTYIAENGMLVEPFAWMASGKLLLLLAAALFALSLAGWVIGRVRARTSHS